MLIRHLKGWEIPERSVSPESVYLTRRKFLKSIGLATLGTAVGCHRSSADSATREGQIRGIPAASPTADLYPPRRNESFTLDRPITPEVVASTYNNFYEFSEHKKAAGLLAEQLTTRPWTIKVTGLVQNPQIFDIDSLVRKMPLEERLYRHRCVEAWAMAVPWTGFPIRALMELVQPLSSAKYIRMVTFNDPKTAPGMRNTSYPWPYHEGLTIAEAANDLSLFVTGIYGHELTKQHGAPIRLVAPWKYGYKSIKSIVELEFVAERPPTFWSTLIPWEYNFGANVNPKIPHPRWSQASERLIGTNIRRATLDYNGYGPFVSDLY